MIIVLYSNRYRRVLLTQLRGVFLHHHWFREGFENLNSLLFWVRSSIPPSLDSILTVSISLPLNRFLS
jgi:hypothetical protein